MMGAGEMSWGDVCLGEGRRGTEDRREEQQGEGKRKRRNSILKAVGTWRPCKILDSPLNVLRTLVAGAEGTESDLVEEHPPPHPGVRVVLTGSLGAAMVHL